MARGAWRDPAFGDEGPHIPQRTTVWFCGWILLVGLVLMPSVGGCTAREDTAPVPADAEAGAAKFKTHCARCHGEQGAGTNQGPPLVHKIYEPSHHGDAAFHLAVANGVRAHHWQFGNMPKIDGVSAQDISEIVLYVRWLQREAGID